ncbi:autophagy protein 5, putative [Hepatocystis sp. ex Piliocolobus tephrosceles]|nr:autophagy protein 5, putative [Hepatocystis sp. ex Piliocolobus tephrosceles]
MEKNNYSPKLNNNKCIIMKDEKLYKYIPIIMHIYGPPYNKIQTKYPLFKIKYENNKSNAITSVHINTLGDFLHEQFPEFVKVVKNKLFTLQKENVIKVEHIEVIKANDMEGIKKYHLTDELVTSHPLPTNEKNLKTLKKNEHNGNNISVIKTVNEINNKHMNPQINKKMYNNYLKNEKVFYFFENDYLIFSSYMFIIINGIQIPLKTPLFWLTSNFTQFDNFLHIIMRIPPY